MITIQRIGAVNQNLLEEVANTGLSLETVFLLYGALVAVAAMLWVIGVFAFGRRRSVEPSSSKESGPTAERISPAVP